MFENMDEMLNNNSGLFDLTEADLLLPETIVFPKGELIEGTILDCHGIEKFGAIKLEVMLTNTDHKDKCHGLMINKPKLKDGKPIPSQKKTWVEFLLAFWTKEAITSGNVDFAAIVGKKIEYRAAEAREYNGKTYQSFYGFKVVE
jgi:hypothetical protein